MCVVVMSLKCHGVDSVELHPSWCCRAEKRRHHWWVVEPAQLGTPSWHGIASTHGWRCQPLECCQLRCFLSRDKTSDKKYIYCTCFHLHMYTSICIPDGMQDMRSCRRPWLLTGFQPLPYGLNKASDTNWWFTSVNKWLNYFLSVISGLSLFQWMKGMKHRVTSDQSPSSPQLQPFQVCSSRINRRSARYVSRCPSTPRWYSQGMVSQSALAQQKWRVLSE